MNPTTAFRARLLPVLLGLFVSLLHADRATNFVLILADDCTYTDTATYGGQAVTPHMDRLAAEGMTFNRCVQAAPMCSPTRHALYTGIYPVKSGAWPNHTYLYDGVRTVAHHLKAAGYRAGFSGKMHINPPEAFPFEYLSTQTKNINPDFAAVDGFLADCVEKGDPFGLILCSNEPHTPWNKGDSSAYPPEDLELPPVLADTPATRDGFSRYLAEITYFDRQVGEALALIEKHGLEDNTVVVVLTEQGNAFPFAKWTCFDKGVASGLIVRWPDRVEPGSQSDALVEYTDIVPTLLAAIDAPVPDGLDGRSFLAVLEGESDSHQDFAFSLQCSVGINNGPGHYGIRSVTDGRHRYILNLTPERTFKNWATGTDFWREWEAAAADGDPDAARLVARYQQRPAEELYDCLEDPWNEINLADEPRLAGTKANLARALGTWMNEQGDLGQPTELAGRERLWRLAPRNQGNEP